ncbi:MAG: hypothetical protein KHW95_07335 [Firmicutes bacterium]|jgi:hypothetical protein|nr:hypothetical protein [Bacillota bacterium]
MPLINHAGGGSSFAAIIQVTYTKGATCTCELDGTVYTAPDTSGNYSFKVHHAGIWTVRATRGSKTTSDTVVITADKEVKSAKLHILRIFGISRDITNSSPAWARTDDAVGMTATASKGTVAGSSDFDDCYPWNGIARQTLSTGDVMVKIPKFWYRRYREGNIEYIKIADAAVENFEVHPTFTISGKTTDCFYIQAYPPFASNTTHSYVSKSATSKPTSTSGGADNPEFYKAATARGSGWSLFDLAALSALQMLILVEFANNDVQSVIGRGVVDTYNIPDTGGCDSVPGLTGIPAGMDGQVSVVWRGIEDLWGGLLYQITGVLTHLNAGQYVINTTPTKYNDYASFTYTLTYGIPTGSGSKYIVKVGLDPEKPWIMLPEYNGSTAQGSESTYMCDAINRPKNPSYTTYPMFNTYRGGGADGLFCIGEFFESGTSSTTVYVRMVYRPQ